MRPMKTGRQAPTVIIFFSACLSSPFPMIKSPFKHNLWVPSGSENRAWQTSAWVIHSGALRSRRAH